MAALRPQLLGLSRRGPSLSPLQRLSPGSPLLFHMSSTVSWTLPTSCQDPAFSSLSSDAGWQSFSSHCLSTMSQWGLQRPVGWGGNGGELHFLKKTWTYLKHFKKCGLHHYLCIHHLQLTDVIIPSDLFQLFKKKLQTATISTHNPISFFLSPERAITTLGIS